jgi:hypothetical protein
VFFFNKFIDFQNCNNQVKFEKWHAWRVNISMFGSMFESVVVVIFKSVFHLKIY